MARLVPVVRGAGEYLYVFLRPGIIFSFCFRRPGAKRGAAGAGLEQYGDGLRGKQILAELCELNAALRCRRQQPVIT